MLGAAANAVSWHELGRGLMGIECFASPNLNCQESRFAARFACPSIDRVRENYELGKFRFQDRFRFYLLVRWSANDRGLRAAPRDAVEQAR